jgi:hypothetical protein
VTSCQVCGRRQGLRADGTIRFHNVRAVPCPGIGFVPIEQDDGRLRSYAREVETAASAANRELCDLYDRRANYIPPELYDRLGRLTSESLRLRRRIARLESWPARFERDMERQGWGSPPPAYLRERAERATLATML